MSHPRCPAMGVRAFSAAILAACLVAGCRGDTTPTDLDGLYRATVAPADLAAIDTPGESGQEWGTWTLALAGSRFALTRENAHACTWAYGALALAGERMRLTVIDAGGSTPGSSTEPGDRYRMTWSRYHDVLTLHTTTNDLAARPWRQIATKPSVPHLSRRCPPPPDALAPTGAERAVPSAAAARIEFTGDLVKTGPATWEGAGRSARLGRGRLALRGPVHLLRIRSRARLWFALRFTTGLLRGCAVVETVPRPHARYLWGSSSGQVTATSPSLREYRGLPVTIVGVTRSTDRPARMHGDLYSQTPATRVPGDLC
jgi:hypothetical protein